MSYSTNTTKKLSIKVWGYLTINTLLVFPNKYRLEVYMDNKFKDIREQAADRLKSIKDGVSATTDKIKQMPGNATTAASDKLKDISTNVSTATSEKIHEWVDEFNKAVPYMKALGFTVKTFSIGVGLIPELNATLVGAVD